jgi:hypothetical protein
MSIIPVIPILSHYGKPNCKNCKANAEYFCSIFIPINAKNVKWELPKKPATLIMNVFENHYIITICTNCNILLD